MKFHPWYQLPAIAGLVVLYFIASSARKRKTYPLALVLNLLMAGIRA